LAVVSPILALVLSGSARAADPEASAPPPLEPSVELATDPWGAMQALESERSRRGRRAPIFLFSAATVELATGIAVAATSDERTLGFGLAVGGAVQGAVALFGEDANHRRTVSFESRMSSIDRMDPGAADAVASQLRLDAERSARADAFGLGANVGLMALGGLLGFAGCTSVVSDVVGMSCDLPGSMSLVAVGLIGGVHSAGRWRSDTRLAGDLAILDERIPSVIPE
jgi:hypothetical protein